MAAAFALTLALGLQRPSLEASSIAAPSQVPAAIDWGPETADSAPAAEPLLQVGAYITNISDIDLMEDQLLHRTVALDPLARGAGSGPQ